MCAFNTNDHVFTQDTHPSITSDHDRLIRRSTLLVFCEWHTGTIQLSSMCIYTIHLLLQERITLRTLRRVMLASA
jgi:hypothetical protein